MVRLGFHRNHPEILTMTKSKPLPPVEELAKLFVVDPTSPSGLRWKITPGRRVKAGDVAGTLNNCDYWRVMVSGRMLKVHRVVYALVHERDPGELEIDHIDRNPSNNDINNLRLVDRSTNQFNIGPRRNNKLGVKGVYWHKGDAKYQAQITTHGKTHSLGRFDTIEKAAAARQAAEKRFLLTLPHSAHDSAKPF